MSIHRERGVERIQGERLPVNIGNPRHRETLSVALVTLILLVWQEDDQSVTSDLLASNQGRADGVLSWLICAL